MKKLLIIGLMISLCSPVFGAVVELKDLDEANVREPAFRVGLTDDPEKKFVEVKKHFSETPINSASAQKSDEELTYADLSIKRMSKEISQELELDETDMYEDLTLLWQGAATKSDTINFALYKLANPDEGKPNEKSIKKVLMSIASMSTLIGAGMGNPAIAAGSMLGSNIFGIMGQDTQALNYKYTKVTDADMILLLRKIEDLQQLTVNLYNDYMSSKKMFEMTTKIAEQRKRFYDSAQNLSREIILVTDAYYRTALDEQIKARSDFYTKRAALEQFVGNEVFQQFEDNLSKREKDN